MTCSFLYVFAAGLMELFTSSAEGGLSTAREEEAGPHDADGRRGGAPDNHNKSDVTRPWAREKIEINVSFLACLCETGVLKWGEKKN